ncbi:MAG: UDP-glucose dehydrogenase family protein [Acidimicrobiales bacterium]
MSGQPEPARRLAQRPRRVAVVGAGYVGLPTAAALAHFGHRVVCAERDGERLAMLRRGEVPIVEDGLADLIAEGVAGGNLRFVGAAAEAAAGAEFVFLCVPTPSAPDGAADLSFVEAAAGEIAGHLDPGAVVVNKSTVPVGTVGLVERVTGRDDVTVVSNPEFLREGTAVGDSLHPDRVVVGADDPRSATRVGELFAPTGAPLIVTDTVTAETIKYASNAFLATKLSFVNALACLCESVGADVRDLVLGLGYDKRIGFEFLRPGPGWGGSCLPKDTAALVSIAADAGYDFALLRSAIAANHEQADRVMDKIGRAAGELEGAVVAVWGLAFKAGTDDRRSSPAVAIARRLVGAGARVRAYDPTVAVPAPGQGPEDLEGIEICGDPYDACRDARVAVVLTEWDELRRIDFAKLRDLMAVPSVVDARNLMDPAALRRLGFAYTGIGRP